MHGKINNTDFNESFTLPKDMAYNFAHDAFQIAVKYGIPKTADIRAMHGYYDKMFSDVLAQLNHKPGDPIKPEHLE